MLKPVQILVALVAIVSLTGHAMSASNATTSTTTTAPVSANASRAMGSAPSDSKTGNSSDIDYVAVMQKCNQSFPISIGNFMQFIYNFR